MNSTPQPPSAAGEHFADAERDPRRPAARPERDRHIQIALVHGVLAVAAGVLGEWQTVADRENHQEPPAQNRS